MVESEGARERGREGGREGALSPLVSAPCMCSRNFQVCRTTSATRRSPPPLAQGAMARWKEPAVPALEQPAQQRSWVARAARGSPAMQCSPQQAGPGVLKGDRRRRRMPGSGRSLPPGCRRRRCCSAFSIGRWRMRPRRMRPWWMRSRRTPRATTRSLSIRGASSISGRRLGARLRRRPRCEE